MTGNTNVRGRWNRETWHRETIKIVGTDIARLDNAASHCKGEHRETCFSVRVDAHYKFMLATMSIVWAAHQINVFSRFESIHSIFQTTGVITVNRCSLVSDMFVGGYLLSPLSYSAKIGSGVFCQNNWRSKVAFRSTCSFSFMWTHICSNFSNA